MVPGKMAYICKVLQNDGILLQQYMVSQHRRPQFEEVVTNSVYQRQFKVSL